MLHAVEGLPPKNEMEQTNKQKAPNPRFRRVGDTKNPASRCSCSSCWDLSAVKEPWVFTAPSATDVRARARVCVCVCVCGRVRACVRVCLRACVPKFHTVSWFGGVEALIFRALACEVFL